MGRIETFEVIRATLGTVLGMAVGFAGVVAGVVHLISVSLPF
jgi:hypothetical protein